MIELDQLSTILTLTPNPSVDLHTSTDSVQPERKLRCATLSREPGGGGINVARAIRKLGGRATAMFAAGGRNGDQLAELVDREEIESLTVRVDGETRENLHVFERSTGRQYRFILPGTPLSEEDGVRVRETIGKMRPTPDFVVASGSLPEGLADDFYGGLVRELADRSCRVLVDTSGLALREALGKGLFLIKPNLGEFRALVGAPLPDDLAIEAAATEMIRSGQVENLLISLGRGGAILVTSDGTARIQAPAVEIVSTVGAGDSTMAGVVLGLARGMALDDAARFGVAAGTAAVMTPGTELCRREDAERLYRSIR